MVQRASRRELCHSARNCTERRQRCWWSTCRRDRRPLSLGKAPYARDWRRHLKLLTAVILLIIGAVVAGAYFDFNPALLIFVILGFGIYMVGRSGPRLPEGTHVSFGDTYGVYLHRQDFVPPATDSHSARTLPAGLDPSDPKNTGQ